MIYKLTSVKRVIAKVFTDLDLKEGDHRVSDLVEWSGEALEKIGAFPSFVNKVTGKDSQPFLEVSNYQAKLPNDFHNMVQVSYSPTQNGPFYSMRYGTGNFDQGNPTTTEVTNTDVSNTSDIVVLAMNLYDLDYTAALTKINNEPETRSKLGAILNLRIPFSTTGANNPMATTSDITYVITSNYIKTNVETGYLMLAYQAIPTDSQGYPMIPDDQSFIEAIYWYLVMKLYYPQWVAGQVRDAVYYDARRSWNYYCKQAYGDALLPNTDQLESIKNSWLRLVPELNEHASGFSTLGQSQMIYRNN
jgi:hypothetical protein